jgi:hypothetical protein
LDTNKSNDILAPFEWPIYILSALEKSTTIELYTNVLEVLQMKLILKAVYIEGNMRYEKDLAPHFKDVSIRNIFPPHNEVEIAKIAWSTRTWRNGVQIK